MTVTFFFGKPRSGKTLHLTMNGFNDYSHGRNIYANYKLKFPPLQIDKKVIPFAYTNMSLADILGIRYMAMDRNPKTLLIQEASKWFDSRRSGKEENVLLSSVTGQSGKRNIDILYDDQFPTRIDKGLRDVTDYSIWCNCVTMDNAPVYFEYIYYYGFLGVPIGKSYKIPAFMMQQFYTYYDTYELTNPLVKED